MKKIFALILTLTLVLALAACGNSAEDALTSSEPTETVTETAPETLATEPEQEPAGASVEAGTYMYYEDKGDMGVIPWTVVLNEDGTATVTEANVHIGDQVHNCAEWTDNGDGTFTTGAWDSVDGPMSEFFAEDGSATWEIPEEGICQPINGTPSADPALAELNDELDDMEAGGPPENGPESSAQIAPAAGTYMYYEDKGDMGIIPWTIVLNEDGTATVTEANEFIGDQVHNCAEWTDNGDGTFTTGAWDAVGGPMSEFFAEDGSATWEIPEEGICQPVGGTPSADPALVG